MDRSRTRVTKNDLATMETKWYRSGTLALADSYSYSKEFEGMYMTDKVIDNFHARRAKGELFFNPMCQKFNNFSQEAAIFGITATLGGRVDTGTLGVRPSLVAVTDLYPYSTMWTEINTAFLNRENDIGQTRNYALNGAFAKTSEEVLLLYASLGESKETLQMIVSIIGRIRALVSGKWISKIKPGEPTFTETLKLLSKQGKTYADYWMEARYGLRPLIYELQAAFSLMEASLNKRFRQTARKRAIVRVPISISDTQVLYDHWTYLEAKRHEFYEYQVNVGVMFSPMSTEISWTKLLGLDQPLLSLWELTRLSFMIDRIIDVGSWIQANEYNPSIVVLGTFQKETLRHVVEVNPVRLVVDWERFGYIVADKSYTGGESVSSTSWVRRIAASKPTLPAMKIRFNWPEILDAAIITSNLIKKKA